MAIYPFREDGSSPIFHLLAVLFLLACKPVSNNAKPIIAHEGPLVPVVNDFTLDHDEKLQRVYTLRAREAQIHNEERKAFVSSPFLVLYVRGKQDINVEAQSQKGVVHIDTKDVILEGDVIYKVIPQKTTLTTQKLIYWAKRQETEVPEAIGYKLQTLTGLVEGSGMISKEDLTR